MLISLSSSRYNLSAPAPPFLQKPVCLGVCPIDKRLCHLVGRFALLLVLGVALLFLDSAALRLEDLERKGQV